MRYKFKPRLVSVLLVLILCSFFTTLGVWQITRFESQRLELQLQHDYPHQVINVEQLSQRYSTDFLSKHHFYGYGKFNNAHHIIMKQKDPTTHQLGFELYTPFYIFGKSKALLVDRGFYTDHNQLDNAVFYEFGEQSIGGKLIPPSIQLQAFMNQKDYKYILIPTHSISFSLFNSPIDSAIEFFMIAGILLALSLLNCIKKI